MDKISESQNILKELGLPKRQQNKIAALTLLAFCKVTPKSSWSDAIRSSMTLSKDIIHFVNKNYDQDYQPNTRESFRKEAINPFVRYGILELNPDNPTLPTQSSKTHYAINSSVLSIIQKYNTPKWSNAIESFKNKVENIVRPPLIKRIEIKNFKSIQELSLEMGQFNILIGANGSGKSNILEAIAMMSASKDGNLTLDGLIDRGVRVARPTLTLSSFLNMELNKTIEVNVVFNINGREILRSSKMENIDPNNIYARWFDREANDTNLQELISYIQKLNDTELNSQISARLHRLIHKSTRDSEYSEILGEYAIYSPYIQALRGLVSESQKSPLGITGEGLDLLLSDFDSFERKKLLTCNLFFNWLSKIEYDKSDTNKLEGLKLRKSSSRLYFYDKFMRKGDNFFSAESANEGILHVLFYLALFISDRTPVFFAIDNIETSLNPKLCRSLIKELVTLSKDRGKQVIITTHNPAVLDGLNLNDNEQRLFEISRSDHGYTQVRRIKRKADFTNNEIKLSEMWMNGYFGTAPNEF